MSNKVIIEGCLREGCGGSLVRTGEYQRKAGTDKAEVEYECHLCGRMQWIEQELTSDDFKSYA